MKFNFIYLLLLLVLIDSNICTLAGRTTTNDELEEMLEQGNPAVFTQGVIILVKYIVNC